MNSDYALFDQEYDSTYYPLTSTKLGWINCDYFLSSEENVNVRVKKLNGGTINYLVFKDLNSIMRLSEYLEFEAGFNNIPVGSRVTAIGISKEGSDYYYGSKDVYLEKEGQLVSLDYNIASIKDITEQLKRLDQ